MFSAQTRPDLRILQKTIQFFSVKTCTLFQRFYHNFQYKEKSFFPPIIYTDTRLIWYITDVLHAFVGSKRWFFGDVCGLCSASTRKYPVFFENIMTRCFFKVTGLNPYSTVFNVYFVYNKICLEMSENPIRNNVFLKSFSIRSVCVSNACDKSPDYGKQPFRSGHTSLTFSNQTFTVWRFAFFYCIMYTV